MPDASLHLEYLTKNVHFHKIFVCFTKILLNTFLTFIQILIIISDIIFLLKFFKIVSKFCTKFTYVFPNFLPVFFKIFSIFLKISLKFYWESRSMSFKIFINFTEYFQHFFYDLLKISRKFSQKLIRTFQYLFNTYPRILQNFLAVSGFNFHITLNPQKFMTINQILHNRNNMYLSI